MAITYPLVLPSTPGPKKATCFLETIAESSRSPYSGKTQVYDWTVDLYHLHLELPPMNAQQAKPWVEFLRKMRGLVGTFQYDVSELLAASSITGTESSGSTALKTFKFKESISSWDIDDDNTYWIVIDAIEEPAS